MLGTKLCPFYSSYFYHSTKTSKKMTKITQYEKLRLANIERNKALLSNLGITNSLLGKQKQKRKPKPKKYVHQQKRKQPKRDGSTLPIVETVESPIKEPRSIDFDRNEDIGNNVIRCCPRHLVINDVSYGRCRPKGCEIVELRGLFPRDVRCEQKFLLTKITENNANSKDLQKFPSQWSQTYRNERRDF